MAQRRSIWLGEAQQSSAKLSKAQQISARLGEARRGIARLSDEAARLSMAQTRSVWLSEARCVLATVKRGFYFQVVLLSDAQFGSAQLSVAYSM